MAHTHHPDPRTPGRALLAGGGSGGHVFPAIAIGEELERRGWRVSYTGTATGMEARIAASRGLDFHALPARAVAGKGPLERLGAIAVTLRSIGAAAALLRRLGTTAVVATGGYASVPAGVAAFLRRRPLILVEPNAAPGLANRALSRVATVAAVAWPEAGKALRCRSCETGVPVRRDFTAVPSALPPGPPWRLLVLGGSQGSVALNQAVPAALAVLAARRGTAAAGGELPLTVLHQAGRGKDEGPRADYAGAGIDAAVAPFLDDVAGAMASAHLVLSRSGAVTLAEIAAAGRPSLLFPLHLAGGHQIENARAFARAGAAAVIEGEVAPETLAAELERLLVPRRLEAMAAAARGLARPAAASAIADLVEETVARR